LLYDDDDDNNDDILLYTIYTQYLTVASNVTACSVGAWNAIDVFKPIGCIMGGVLQLNSRSLCWALSAAAADPE